VHGELGLKALQGAFAAKGCFARPPQLATSLRYGRRVFGRCAAALGAVACAAAGCGSSHHGVGVSADGSVGTLRLDRSTRDDVVAFAGRPERETHGRYDSYPPFDALGYGCPGPRATTTDGLPRCRTVYYVDVGSGRLEELYTTDPRYVTPGGVRPGMATDAAERRLHRRVPKVGCLADIVLDGGGAYLAIVFDGRRVDDFVLVSKRRASGAFDCIDS
jgi:hypothetical protein